MIEEKTVIDKIEVLETGHIQVRKAKLVLRDGVEIAKEYERHVLDPNHDLTGEDERVQAIAKAAWGIA